MCETKDYSRIALSNSLQDIVYNKTTKQNWTFGDWKVTWLRKKTFSLAEEATRH